MGTEIFKASTKYNDLAGSSAADRADMNDASNWLKDQNLIKSSEILVGYNIYVSPALSAGTEGILISVTFILFGDSNYDSFSETIATDGFIKVRKIAHDFTPHEFFSLFKRFNVTLSSGGLLEGRECAS